MKNRGTKPLVLIAAALLFALPAFAGQGRPGGGGGGQGRQQRPTTGQKKGQGPATQSSRQRIRATDQQRDELRNCTQTADRIREQAREMDRLARSKGFDAGKARQQRDQIRDQLRTMEREHERLMNGMSGDQQAAFRKRMEQMNQIRERVNTQLGQLDNALAQTSPNGKQVAERARQISQEMNRWRSHYRAMESEMGVTP